MKPAILAIVLSLLVVNADAQDELSVEYSVLWNKFNQLEVVGEYVIGLSGNGLSLMTIDQGTGFLMTENTLTLSGHPAELKRFDNLAVIRTENFRLHFVDLANLPELTHLGTVDPGYEFADFVYEPGFIYLARWFDGIARFELNGYSEIVLDDVSHYGVLITQLYIESNDLFALDRYNGLLRYDISPVGIGQPVDSLIVKKRIAEFVPFDNYLMLFMEEGGGWITDFSGGGNSLIDSTPEISLPQDFFVTPDEYVFVSGHFVNVMNRADHAQQSSARLENSYGDGDLLVVNGIDYLILPGSNGGASRYPLVDPANFNQLFSNHGSINEITIGENLFYAAGPDRTFDVYSFDKETPPLYSHTLYNDLGDVKMFDQRADTILALLVDSDVIGMIIRADDPDSFFFDASVSVDHREILDLEFISQGSDGCWFSAARSDALDIYHYEGGAISLVSTWAFSAALRAFEIQAGKLWVSREDFRFELYDIDDEQNISFKASVLTDEIVDEIFMLNDTAYLFGSSLLTVMDMTVATFPKVITGIVLPLATVDLASDSNRRLFAVGAEGICILTLTDSIPTISAYSQFGGSHIAYDSDWLAVTDGGSVNLFDVAGIGSPGGPHEELPTSYFLAQNFPNPFNGSTRISFELPKSSVTSLTVYNLLGREVNTLFDQLLPAGEHSVLWDGTNAAGKSVSSALYFYRLESGRFVESKKMLLIK